MAMLFMPIPFAVKDLHAWFKPDSQGVRERERAIDVLNRLRIIQDPPSREGYQLSKAFRKSLQQALTGGGNHQSFGIPCSALATEGVTVAFLDNYARTQWETILYFVVGSVNNGSSGQTSVSAGTRTLLQSGGFVKLKGSRADITQDGFTFLLQEVNAQVWTLLIVYLEYSSNLGMDSVDVLSFLFTLGSLELGIPYSTANLTRTQHSMLDDLADFG
ncbi:RNA polymerase II transcription factor B 52 kDa subunit, partial [Elasticomyces elasticus]